MSIDKVALTSPDRPAIVIVETGDVLTYGALAEQSRRVANALLGWGLRHGDRIAVLMENRAEFMVAVWAGLRAGLRVVPINRFLKSEEVCFIIDNADARAVFCCDALTETAKGVRAALPPTIEHYVMAGEAVDGFANWRDLVSPAQAGSTPDLPAGALMYYTSGSTGQPKGVLFEMRSEPFSAGFCELSGWIASMMAFTEEDRFLLTAPLYHSGPCWIAVSVADLGGVLYVSKRFDAPATLHAIEEHRITQCYVVPTMMKRMLQLPAAQRNATDLSSLKRVLHTAEPCPQAVKRAMIEWWGPKFVEVYGASETLEGTEITSEEWLKKPGSVGRAVGCTIHIVGRDGEPLPIGQLGTVYFESETAPHLQFHKDAEATARSRNDRGWITAGDIGYLDEDGYLFLADRRENTVISGGVNIYPRESEDALVSHPDVLDVVCFGVPDPDMGERLIAVVVPRPGVRADEALGAAITGYCKSRIAHYKCPKDIHFIDEMPRLPSGKIMRRQLIAQYMPA